MDPVQVLAKREDELTSFFEIIYYPWHYCGNGNHSPADLPPRLFNKPDPFLVVGHALIPVLKIFLDKFDILTCLNYCRGVFLSEIHHKSPPYVKVWLLDEVNCCISV